MKAKRYVFVVVIGIFGLLSGCLANVDDDGFLRFRAPDDESYMEAEKGLAARLDLYVPGSNSDGDHITLTMETHLDAMSGVNVSHYDWDSPDEKEPDDYRCCSIIFAFREFDSDQYQKIGEVGEFTTTTKRYAAEITLDEFENLVDKLRTIEFYSKPYSTQGDYMTCIHGTIYFVTAKVGAKFNSVTRQSCDQGFTDDFHATRAIFDLAREKFPMVIDRITKSEMSVVDAVNLRPPLPF